ncbi:MAG: hypothetical protein AVDCRST_MAG93-933, partial [uncultured Chloroflexia bacterium]
GEGQAADHRGVRRGGQHAPKGARGLAPDGRVAERGPERRRRGVQGARVRAQDRGDPREEQVGLHRRRCGPHAPRGQLRAPPPGPEALRRRRRLDLALQPAQLGTRSPEV